MLSECNSSLLLLYSHCSTAGDRFCHVHDSGDDPISLRATDEGDRASCWSAPRLQPLCIHVGNGRYNQNSSGWSADEGDHARLSCGSAPTSHHQGSDDSSFVIAESDCLVRNKVMQRMQQEDKQGSQRPVNSICIDLDRSTPPKRKRDSSTTSRKTSFDKISCPSIVTFPWNCNDASIFAIFNGSYLFL